MTTTADIPGASARKANPTGETSIHRSSKFDPRPWRMRLLTTLLVRGQLDPPAVLAKQRF
jgi:hypothetical protein